MSKFIDKLNSVSSGGLQPMGFRTTRAKPKPKMLLVAHIAEAGAKPAVAGADAVLLSIPKTGAKPPKTLAKAFADIPWGGWLKEVTSQGVKQLGEAGADFVVFPPDSAAQAILEEEKLGKIMTVEPGLDAGLLRALDDLPMDAVLIAGEEPSLSWERLMLIRHGVNLLSKPWLVTISPDVTAGELQALFEAGVAGVVVGASADFGELRRAIDRLAPPKAAKRRRIQALVPRIGGGGETTVEEAEEDED